MHTSTVSRLSTAFLIAFVACSEPARLRFDGECQTTEASDGYAWLSLASDKARGATGSGLLKTGLYFQTLTVDSGRLVNSDGVLWTRTSYGVPLRYETLVMRSAMSGYLTGDIFDSLVVVFERQP